MMEIRVIGFLFGCIFFCHSLNYMEQAARCTAHAEMPVRCNDAASLESPSEAYCPEIKARCGVTPAAARRPCQDYSEPSTFQVPPGSAFFQRGAAMGAMPTPPTRHRWFVPLPASNSLFGDLASRQAPAWKSWTRRGRGRALASQWGSPGRAGAGREPSAAC